MQDTIDDVQEQSSSSADEAIEPIDGPTPGVIEIEGESFSDAEELTREDWQDANSDEPEPEATEEEVEEAVEETETEATETVEEEQPPPEPQIPLSRLRQEADKRKREAKRAEELQQKLQELQSQQPVVQTSKPVAPKLSDPEINFDEAKFAEKNADYQEKLVDWKLELREKQIRETEAQYKEQARMEQHSKKVSSYVQENPEYRKILDDMLLREEEVKYPPAVAQAILDSENGPELDYLILKNRDKVLSDLDYLSPPEQLMYLGELKAASKSVATPVKKISKAPTPIKQTRGSATRLKSEDAALKEEFNGDFKIY